eukprot:6329147-Heterocapsa_arctica.AAC.1
MAEQMEGKKEEVALKATMQRLKNAEYSLQGMKGQEESLKIVKAQMQEQASACSEKSREAQAQSLLAKKLNKVKKRKDIKVKLEVWKSQVARAFSQIERLSNEIDTINNELEEIGWTL